MNTRAAPNRAGVDRTWYRIVNKAERAEVFLYDEIGAWGTTAGDFAKELAEVTAKAIDLRISSAGGEVFDGLAIYAALQRHPARVTVHIDGLAASIASVIAMAGDDIVIDRYAQMMIHEAHAIACGSTKDMTAMASLLNEYSDNIAAIYASRAGGDTAMWRGRMRDETWFSASEAVKAGLADRIAEGTVRGKPAATWDLSIFNHAGRDQAPDPFADAEPVSPEPTPEPVVDPELPESELFAFAAPLFDPDVFRSSMAAALRVEYDPAQIRDLMASVAQDAPAAPTSAPPPVDLGPLPEPPEPVPETPPSPWDVIRTAVRMAADDAPAPPQQTKTPDPADEPGFLMDANAFRTALRRATL